MSNLNKNFNKKIALKKRIFSLPMLLILLVVLIIICCSVFGLIKSNNKTRENRDLAFNQLASLQKREQELKSGIEKLKTADGMEENIRDKFRATKEGEELIVIVEDKKDPSVVVEKSGFLAFLKRVFSF
jgi:cell division protein FtsB